MARLKNVTFVKRLGILLRTVPSGENVCGQAGHLYRDCRNEPVAATNPGPRELPVDPEDSQIREAMKSDSLVNRTVPPVESVPTSIGSSDGFIPIRRRTKRKRARIFESSDIGNVDNCLVNDNKWGYCQ